MRWPLLLILLLSYAIYAWAIARFFARSRRPAVRMRLLGALGTVTALVHLSSICLYPTPSLLRVALSYCLALCAVLLFSSARRATHTQPPPLAFDAAPASQIVVAGPYRYVRHPFYLSYSMTWFAGTVATSSRAAWLLAGVMLCVYVCVAAGEERDLLRSHPDEYSRYRMRTGALFPRLMSRRLAKHFLS